ncbi:MAG TPA: signal recognition particle-docking protein FtsY [Candidatus Faeciplasma avium]|uniref:Signal recognition particle receptor FtsY n=1 Tax=Candidatus Faeciplasma avium TaxID=2840798 RepID=A0A9D1T3X1_9FIRM|nr:signal recognition particle-docking protein FtsY [Candidatus Faeciplasma avium]
MGFFEKLKAGLTKTKSSLIDSINSLIQGSSRIDDDFFDELEETLIMSDIGGKTSEKIVSELKNRVKEEKIKDTGDVKAALKEIIAGMLGEDSRLDLSTKPSVILVIGVNGAGKTTTIGKLSYQLSKQGKKVLVAAADTFRAAAIEQLAVWCERAGVQLVRHKEGSDPAAVVYDAMDAARARDCDVVIIDTAGRLHNKKNLMNELGKISKIVHTKAEGCALEVLLALDATTGQNAVNQAREFNQAASITGIILTKLDSTSKGGIIIPIASELGLPVKLVTVGEKIEDIQDFCAADFAAALFDEETED